MDIQKIGIYIIDFINVMKKVGIIGGVGPETTSKFYLDVIFSCQREYNVARPGIIITSVPMLYEIEKNFITQNKDSEKYIPFLLEEAKRLERAGADFIVMPCNSLHIFIQNIRDAVGVPVLSIVEETVKFLKKKSFRNVGIISTSATLENKLYENAFKENGIGYVTPDDIQQAKIGKLIFNLVRGQQSNEDREELIQIIAGFEKKAVDCVVLACTDLQLLTPKYENLQIFDTMKILSDATVEKILE